MRRYQIERSVVLAFGFLLGALLAMCIAPGDILLWFVAGLFLSIFCHEQFVTSYSGELFWRHPRRHHRPPKA